MKKSAVLLIAVALLVFSGCFGIHVSDESTTAQQSVDVSTTVSEIVPVVSNVPAYETVITQHIAESTAEQQTTYSQETTTQLLPRETAAATEQTTEFVTLENVTTVESTVLSEEITSEEPVTEVYVTEHDVPVAEESTAAEVKTTVPPVSDEIDLSISMPEKNGTMVTDESPDNKFIRIVNKEKGIEPGLLLAVYSVPESGQNYVFEFYEGKDFTAENIRRVYLIDTFGDITSVAAADNTEKENISPVENWFCMNVLIKEIIYPAVAGEVE